MQVTPEDARRRESTGITINIRHHHKKRRPWGRRFLYYATFGVSAFVSGSPATSGVSTTGVGTTVSSATGVAEIVVSSIYGLN